jgi:adhesin transport system membrane fusion protein
VRAGFYYITAPRDCYIVKAIATGIGETVKEGEEIVSIAPTDVEIAGELYIKPMDVPIVHAGSQVRLLFDGWPALVISGWEQATFGTFAGKVYSIDRFANAQSHYRVLVQADTTAKEKKWPDALRIGSGVSGVILLKEVPLWYELWRQFNGFPPEFYSLEEANETKNKAPIQKLK